MTQSGTVRAAWLAVLLLALSGCESRVSEKNFSKITAGMSEQEVIELLGKPSETSALALGPVSGSSSVWRDEGVEINVQFVNGKVQLKNMQRR